MAYLRGDELIEALLPTAADLVVAVHDRDAPAVEAAFAVAERLAGDALAAARHLAVVLGGMASLDLSIADQLGWTCTKGAPAA
jgi:hypothetical protein